MSSDDTGSGEVPMPDTTPPNTPTELARRVASTADMCNLPPLLPPGYTHIEKLGEGSQGKVHLATNSQGERVAIKIVDRDDGRAEQEKNRLNSLRHEHLVEFRDWIPATSGNPFCYLVMQYIEGEPLHRRTLTALERGIVFVQLAEALAYLHSQKITHRDVKPSNIIVCAAGEAVRAYLVDLGVAKNHAATTGHTRTLEFVGTRSYSAPEQLRMARTAEHAADVFSLGICLYESIAEELPYATAHSELSRQIRQIECVRPKRIQVPGLPRQVDTVTRAMLHPLQKHRPESAALPALLIHAPVDCVCFLGRR